jgi:Arc/MetJ family transcription regulator
MRIEIELDDTLMDAASRVCGVTEPQELIEEALRVLIAATKRQPLANLKGKIEFAPGYDHKQLR